MRHGRLNNEPILRYREQMCVWELPRMGQKATGKGRRQRDGAHRELGPSRKVRKSWKTCGPPEHLPELPKP